MVRTPVATVIVAIAIMTVVAASSQCKKMFLCHHWTWRTPNTGGVEGILWHLITKSVPAVIVVKGAQCRGGGGHRRRRLVHFNGVKVAASGLFHPVVGRHRHLRHHLRHHLHLAVVHHDDGHHLHLLRQVFLMALNSIVIRIVTLETGTITQVLTVLSHVLTRVGRIIALALTSGRHRQPPTMLAVVWQSLGM